MSKTNTDAAAKDEERAKALRREQTNSSLMMEAAKDMLGQLRMPMNADAKSLRQLGYQHWDERLGREVQVHVLVVADPTDFLEPFHTEITT